MTIVKRVVVMSLIPWLGPVSGRGREDYQLVDYTRSIMKLRIDRLLAGIVLLGPVLACDRTQGAPGPAPQASAPAPRASAPPLEASPAPLHFSRAVLWKPAMQPESPVDPYLAPLIYLESAPQQPTGASAGESGAIGAARWREGALELDPGEPTLYVDESEWVRGALRHRQLTFTWLRGAADAPPSAQGLRLTLDSEGYPAIFETLAHSSGERRVYISEDLERACVEAHGAPLAGRRFAVEGPPAEGSPLRVVAVVSTGAMPMGPFVYQAVGSPDVGLLHCRCSPSQVEELDGTREYALRPLASLADLPSMSAPGAALTFDAPERALAGLRLPPRF